MSIHVCKCVHNGREEFHLRYPGMTEGEARDLADRINAGALAADTPGSGGLHPRNRMFVLNNATNDQLAKVMLLCGSPEQQEAAIVYAGLPVR